jgi:hypothetical protein
MLKINDLERHHAALRADLSRTALAALDSGRYVLGSSADYIREYATFLDEVAVGR